MKRALVYLLVFGGGGLFWAGASAYRTHQAPVLSFTAAAPAETVTRPAYDATLPDKTVRFLEERERQDPKGAIGIALLASAYHRRFEEAGDADDLIRAEAAARRSLRIRAYSNGPAYHTLAASLMGQHRFAEARECADHLAALGPGSPQADYVRAECDMETGRYDESDRDLKRAGVLVHAIQSTPDPYGQALRARLTEIDGHPTEALALYRAAQEQTDKDGQLPRPTAAWFHDRLGNCLWQRGRADDAEASFNNALRLWDRDTRAMSALAKLRAARGDWPGAIAWAERANRLVPTQENAMLLYDAYQATGDPIRADENLRLVTSGGSALHSHNRAQILFDADHHRNLDEAVALGRTEWATRKDIYTADALAWALFQHKQYAEADTLMKVALSRGTQDGLLFYHAGCLALARGDRNGGCALLQKALALNPFFHPTAPAEARRLLAENAGNGAGR